jgi:hypothetical protein
MASVEVDPLGLSTLAGRCEAHAARLAAIAAAAMSGSGFQPSAAAVETAHADVAAVSARLAARMQSTAAAVTNASANYVTTDADSAVDIAALGASGITAV